MQLYFIKYIYACQASTPKFEKIVAPTCTEPGIRLPGDIEWIGYNHCFTCDRYFGWYTDGSIRVIAKDSWIVPAAGHKTNWETCKTAVPGTPGHNQGYVCEYCGGHFNDKEGKDPIEDDLWYTYSVTVRYDNSMDLAYPGAADSSINKTWALIAEPKEGYEFVERSIVSGSGSILYLNDPESKFTMLGREDLVIQATFKPVEYLISVSYDTALGAVTAPARSESGKTVSLTAAPLDGCGFDGWSCAQASVTLSGETELNASFVMPQENVDISAAFHRHQFDAAACTKKAACEIDGETAAFTLDFASAEQAMILKLMPKN